MTEIDPIIVAAQADRFWSRVDKVSGSIPAHCPELGACWLWTGPTWLPPRHLNLPSKEWYGYHFFNRKKWRASHVSWIISTGSLVGKMFVLHRCDNPPCVRPDHLFLGTHADNNRDMMNKKRNIILRGERHGCSKLTEQDVIEIRRLRASGARRCDLAIRYSVAKQTIYEITHHLAWTHVP